MCAHTIFLLAGYQSHETQDSCWSLTVVPMADIQCIGTNMAVPPVYRCCWFGAVLPSRVVKYFSYHLIVWPLASTVPAHSIGWMDE